MGLPFGIAVPEMQNQRFLDILDEGLAQQVKLTKQNRPQQI